MAVMRAHLDLFSGIGGFALAASWAGYETVLFCEIDPFCQKLLAKNFPGVPIHDDVRTLTGDLVGRPVDLLTGGFPCQPFSVVGRRRGVDDDRHLWPEMARLIDECRPRWVIGENTPGIVGMALDDCLDDLEGLGYESWAVVVPACAVGAPHRRDRVWIVAYAGGAGRQQVSGRAPRDEGTDEGRPETDDHVAARSGQGHRTGAYPDAAHGRIRCRPVSRPRGQSAFVGEASMPGWEGSPRTFRMDDGLSAGMDRHRANRLKALGNAIVPQVAYEIIRLMTPGTGEES